MFYLNRLFNVKTSPSHAQCSTFVFFIFLLLIILFEVHGAVLPWIKKYMGHHRQWRSLMLNFKYKNVINLNDEQLVICVICMVGFCGALFLNSLRFMH